MDKSETGTQANLQSEADKKEDELRVRMERLERLEQEVKEKEKALKLKEKSKKQVLLRLAPSLWEELAAWAEDDYRSINGQIEYLLAECVKQRRKH